MAEVDSLSISIKSSADAASASLDKLISKLQQLQGAAGNGVQIAVTGMKDLASNTEKATSAVGKLVAKFASISAIVKLLKTAISESMGFTETFNYFNVAMKNYTQQAEDYAEKVNRVLGIDIRQWEDAQATFMSLGSAFGITGDRAYTMSKQLTQLVYDYSSLKNEDPTVALYKLRAAFAGELEPIRNWGTDLSKANIQLAATELGITKTFNAMTQAEKAQLRYYLIMKQSTDAQGDMARTLQSPANQLRMLKQALTECARALGNIFIPLLQAVVPIVIVFIRVLTALFEAIARLFGFKYPEVQWYGDYSAGVSGLGDKMDKTGRKAKKLKQQLAGFDEINNLTTNKGGGGGKGGLGGAFPEFPLPTYDFLGDAAEKVNKLKAALEVIAPILLGIGVAIGIIVVGYKWPAIIAGATKLLTNITNGIKFLWLVISEHPFVAIIAIIAGVITALVSLYNNSESFRNWVNQTWEYLKLVFAGVKKRFAELAGGAVALWNTIKSAFQNAPAWFAEKWQLVKSKVIEKWTAIKQGAVDAWTGIKETFAKIPTWFKDKFAAAWQKVKEVFSTGGKIFDGIKEGIVNAFKTVVNAIITGINKIIKIPFDKIKDILRTIKNINILGITPFSWINTSWTVPQIPKLATGGIITSPQLVMAGENGAEAIVPLENNTEWINKVAAQINSTGNNDDVVKAIELLIDVVSNKELIVDGKSLARGISKEINRQTRIMGEGLVY